MDVIGRLRLEQAVESNAGAVAEESYTTEHKFNQLVRILRNDFATTVQTYSKAP